MSQEESDGHILRRWFSIGDLISAVAMLIGMGAMWGSLSKDVATLGAQVSDLRTLARGMTPGAAEALASMRAKDAAQDQQLAEQRQEMRESRSEILTEIRALRVEIISHDKDQRNGK